MILVFVMNVAKILTKEILKLKTSELHFLLSRINGQVSNCVLHVSLDERGCPLFCVCDADLVHVKTQLDVF